MRVSVAILVKRRGNRGMLDVLNESAKRRLGLDASRSMESPIDVCGLLLDVIAVSTSYTVPRHTG